jgi:hypothetical protein
MHILTLDQLSDKAAPKGGTDRPVNPAAIMILDVLFYFFSVTMIISVKICPFPSKPS